MRLHDIAFMRRYFSDWRVFSHSFDPARAVYAVAGATVLAPVLFYFWRGAIGHFVRGRRLGRVLYVAL